MDHTEDQKIVSSRILSGKEDSFIGGLHTSELTIIIMLSGKQAVYTADEARELADEMETQTAAEYIYDLADVLDNKQSAESVKEKWDGPKIYLAE